MSSASFSIDVSKFKVQIDQISMVNCTNVSGIDLNTEKLEIYEGNQDSPNYRKGRTYAEDVHFTRIFSDLNLFNWFKECQSGKITKRSASVVALDDKGAEALRINLIGCWPISWHAPDFSAGSSGRIAYESFTLAVESLDIN